MARFGVRLCATVATGAFAEPAAPTLPPHHFPRYIRTPVDIAFRPRPLRSMINANRTVGRTRPSIG